MKVRLAAYAAAAMLIGFGVIMLPLAIETGPPTYDPTQAPSTYLSPLSEGGNEQRYTPDNTYDPASTSYNIIPSGLILLAGLAVALVAYASLKRQLK